MKTYDYLENVKEDVRNYIEENKIVVTKGAEACDVTIRCYLLGQAISEVLNEIEIENETEE